MREDVTTVDRLIDDLERAGIDVWSDRAKLVVGDDWEAAIRDAIQGGIFFIACFSPNSLAKGRSYMNAELNIAIKEMQNRPYNRKWFLPVLLAECEVPNRDIGGGQTLRSRQALNLYEDWDGGIRTLVDVVRAGTEAPTAGTPGRPGGPATAQPASRRATERRLLTLLLPWLILAFLFAAAGFGITRYLQHVDRSGNHRYVATVRDSLAVLQQRHAALLPQLRKRKAHARRAAAKSLAGAYGHARTAIEPLTPPPRFKAVDAGLSRALATTRADCIHLAAFAAKRKLRSADTALQQMAMDDKALKARIQEFNSVARLP